jgi:hypothetical protein
MWRWDDSISPFSTDLSAKRQSLTPRRRAVRAANPPKRNRDGMTVPLSSQLAPEPNPPLARDAFVRFGEGRHPAALDLAACAAYALAVSEAEPLLFAGGGWKMRDVEGV